MSPRAHSETAANSADAPDASAPFAEKVAVPDDAEPPVLTDAVEEEAIDLAPLPVEKLEDEALLWLGPDTIDPALHSITGPAPDTGGLGRRSLVAVRPDRLGSGLASFVADSSYP